MSRVLIFANGDLPDLESARKLLQAEDFIICADGGTRHALALEITPNVVIGDMDSLPATFQRVNFKGEFLHYPADKNETDLELAIDRALSLKPETIMIIAALGGRMDQMLGNISLLADARLFGCDIRLHDGVEEILLCRDQAKIKGRGGDVVSLIPWGGDVSGIVTENLRWPLQNEILYST